MTSSDGRRGSLPIVLDATEASEVEPSASALLDEVVYSARRSEAESFAAIRTARLVGLEGRDAFIAFRGAGERVRAWVAPEVELGLLDDALAAGGMVLVEHVPGEVPMVAGVLQTRRPEVLKFEADSIDLHGRKEILLRSGKSGLRLKSDGDVEVMGSRISAVSRGLFRIVGRVLRLN